MKLNDFSKVIFTSSNIGDGNMSYVFGEKNNVDQARRKFINKLTIKSESLIIINLEHKNNIVNVSEKDLGKELKGDVLITNKRNIFLGILTAD